MRKVVAVACLVAGLFASTAGANDAIDIQSTPAQIRAAQDGIKQAIEKKEGVYKELSAHEKQRILDEQQVLYRALEGKDSIDALNGPQKIQIANALESIAALVSRAEDDRKVCERVKVLGSNRPQNVCMTVGERRRLRETVQREGIKTSN
jgi:hypothetical protein